MTRLLALTLAAVLGLAACSSSGAISGPVGPSAAGSAAAPSAAPATAAGPALTQAPTVPPTAAPVASASAAATVPAACLAPALKTLTAGKLTIGTDNPAFPPWFGGDPAKGSLWQVSDPASGKGLESATAYAIAQKLGFTNAQVTWVAVPFNNAIQPGPKKFDILLNQVGFTKERATAVDLSDGYFDDSQAVVAFAGSAISGAKTLADVARYQLGAQVGTTSLAYISGTIKPARAARVYNTNDAAIAALKARQIDGIVVDLGTAFYMVGAQLDKGQIVGTLPTVTGQPEHFSVLLGKGSQLTSCVNQAIAVLTADGTLDTIRKIWIEAQGNAPALTP